VVRSGLRARVVAGHVAVLVLGLLASTGACSVVPRPPALSSSAPSSSAPSSAATGDVALPLEGWTRWPLPGSMAASSLALVGPNLVVGGHVGTGDDRTPALVYGAATDPHFTSADVRARSPYGKVADFVSLATDGSSIVALGAAHGGAHANSRWTIWSGTPRRVIDRPQIFYAFGGQEAGDLIDVAWDDRGPMIVGSWLGKHGLDGRIWRVEGETWSRAAPIPSLVNTVARQMGPRVAESRGSATVISGSVVELAGGVRQSAAIWRGSGARWSLIVLPDPGRRSEAWSTDCAAGCTTLGSRDGAVAVWEDDTRARVPDVTVDDHDNGVLLLGGDRTLAVLSSVGKGRLLVGRAGDWRAYTAPDGVVRSALLVGSRLYLVTDDSGGALWSRDLSDILAR
jgi:hypothetical protein